MVEAPGSTSWRVPLPSSRTGRAGAAVELVRRVRRRRGRRRRGRRAGAVLDGAGAGGGVVTVFSSFLLQAVKADRHEGGNEERAIHVFFL